MIISWRNRRNLEINPLQCRTGLHESQSHPRLNICVHLKTNISLFAEYSQQSAMFHNSFISVRRCTYFRRVFRPSPGAQNCTYSVRCLSDKYLTLYVQFWAPDDGRKTSLKYVERLTEIKKFWNVASFWSYSANTLAMRGPMNVKFNISLHAGLFAHLPPRCTIILERRIWTSQNIPCLVLQADSH